MSIELVTDRVSMRGNAIAFVRPSVRPSICLFPLYLSKRLNSGLDFFHVCGSPPWLAGIETKGHRSGSRRGRSDLDPRLRTVF